MGKDAKKAAVSDEWRNKDVEERLSYSLIKVGSLTSALSQGRLVQLVTCLATDACLTADPGVTSSIPARPGLVKIDHEIISTVILLPSADSFKGCCQLQAKVCARITG